MIILSLKVLDTIGGAFLRSIVWLFNQTKSLLGCSGSKNESDGRLAGESGAIIAPDSAEPVYVNIKLYNKHDQVIYLISAPVVQKPKL